VAQAEERRTIQRNWNKLSLGGSERDMRAKCKEDVGVQFCWTPSQTIILEAGLITVGQEDREKFRSD